MFRLIIFEFIKSEPIFIRVLRERLAIANTSSVIYIPKRRSFSSNKSSNELKLPSSSTWCVLMSPSDRVISIKQFQQ